MIIVRIANMSAKTRIDLVYLRWSFLNKVLNGIDKILVCIRCRISVTAINHRLRSQNTSPRTKSGNRVP